MRAREPSAWNAGFTLVEVIVSFTILALVLGSVTVSLSYAARLHRASEAKQSAMSCAERLIAEKLDEAPGLPATEGGADEGGCRWRITRRIARTAFAESARSLVAFRLEILDDQQHPIDAFETFYVERLP